MFENILFCFHYGFILFRKGLCEVIVMLSEIESSIFTVYN